MAVSTYKSIITLNANRSNSLIKMHRVAECIKQNTYTYTHTQPNYMLFTGGSF